MMKYAEKNNNIWSLLGLPLFTKLKLEKEENMQIIFDTFFSK